MSKDKIMDSTGSNDKCLKAGKGVLYNLRWMFFKTKNHYLCNCVDF